MRSTVAFIASAGFSTQNHEKAASTNATETDPTTYQELPPIPAQYNPYGSGKWNKYSPYERSTPRIHRESQGHVCANEITTPASNSPRGMVKASGIRYDKSTDPTVSHFKAVPTP